MVEMGIQPRPAVFELLVSLITKESSLRLPSLGLITSAGVIGRHAALRAALPRCDRARARPLVSEAPIFILVTISDRSIQ